MAAPWRDAVREVAGIWQAGPGRENADCEPPADTPHSGARLSVYPVGRFVFAV